MSRLSPIIALLSAAVLLAGCAAPPNLIARRNQKTLAIPIQKISLLPRRNTSPAEAALDAQLAGELRRHGFAVVKEDVADYTIAASAEVNWSTVPDTMPDDARLDSPPPLLAPNSSGTVLYETSRDPATHPPAQREYHIPTYGVRLKLYPTRELQQGRFTAIWDGYADAGVRPQTELMPAMLRHLCQHLGRISSAG